MSSSVGVTDVRSVYAGRLDGSASSSRISGAGATGMRSVAPSVASSDDSTSVGTVVEGRETYIAGMYAGDVLISA